MWSLSYILIIRVECWRIDAFELWCWKDSWVPWTIGRSIQSILKEISPEYSLDGRILKLKLQYYGHLKRRTNSLEKTLMLGNIEGRREGEDRGWDGWMASPTSWTWIWLSSGIGEGQGSLVCCSPWGGKESDTTERLNWTELSFEVKEKSKNNTHTNTSPPKQ